MVRLCIFDFFQLEHDDDDALVEFPLSAILLKNCKAKKENNKTSNAAFAQHL